MANYILTYDLFGRVPTHGQVHDHIENAEFKEYAKILEDGWYIGTRHTLAEVQEFMMEIFSDNDRLILIEVKAAKFANLQISPEEFEEVLGRNK